MFLDAIRSLLGLGPVESPEAPGDCGPRTDPRHVAACALLLEIAHADGHFSAEEQSHVAGVLARHFGLRSKSGQRLLELAEAARREAVDYHGFTSLLSRGFDLGQKLVLAEVMWELVLADGEIAKREQYLSRKIASLLDLKPGYLSSAKRAAAERVSGRQGGD